MFHSLWCLAAQRKGMVIYMKKAILFLLILSSILFLPACENNNVNISVDDTQKVSTSPAQNLFLAEENAGYDYTSDSPQVDTTTKSQTQAVSTVAAETDADPCRTLFISPTPAKNITGTAANICGRVSSTRFHWKMRKTKATPPAKNVFAHE